MVFDDAGSAILRTLAFHRAWGYAPTLPELFQTLDGADKAAPSYASVSQSLESHIRDGSVIEERGRLALPSDQNIKNIEQRDIHQPRKLRRARKVAKWLARFRGVRFVALCNTTALGYAHDGADLDFFVVARAGTLWTVRLLAGGMAKLLGLSPRQGHERDAVCLSYFIADDRLDLSSHMLDADDPYFRHWFLSLLPLYDDGVSHDLWAANAMMRARHALAVKWILPPDICVSRPRPALPAFRILEKAAKRFQSRWFPAAIKSRMNKDTTVMVNDSVLKFHVNDGRMRYRDKYREICKTMNIQP